MTRLWLPSLIALVFFAASPMPDAVARDKSGVLKASDLIGKRVQDTEGKKLGDIKDLVINPDEGDIEYAVLDFGGFLGIGDKYFAVPWDAFDWSENQKSLVLDVKKRDLKNAPGFDKNNWPDMSDPKWSVTVYEFYEIPVPAPRNEEPKSGKRSRPQSSQ
ncbi:MAG TPA: PRC-barrel domain-containing protein [Nitrospiraceae bacterium]|nr:PRC-barrel domain-containing protein [Nitrospiraceae bacterium]